MKFSSLTFLSFFCSINYLNAYEMYKNACLKGESELYSNNSDYIYPYKYNFYLVNKSGKEYYCDFLFSYVDLKNNKEQLDFTKIACTNGLKINFVGDKTIDPFLTDKLEVVFKNGSQYSVSAINSPKIQDPKIVCLDKSETASNKVFYNFDGFDEKFHLKYEIKKTILSN